MLRTPWNARQMMLLMSVDTDDEIDGESSKRTTGTVDQETLSTILVAIDVPLNYSRFSGPKIIQPANDSGICGVKWSSNCLRQDTTKLVQT
jgi:hypothetical protein